MTCPPVINIRLIDGPLPTQHGNAEPPAHGTGASLVFEGIIREQEDGRRLRSIVYDVYEPMATRELTRLASELAATHALIAVHVEHSRGEVPVGRCSFRLRIESAHRKEALSAMDEFITRMKRDVPIWKVPRWADDARPA